MTDSTNSTQITRYVKPCRAAFQCENMAKREPDWLKAWEADVYGKIREAKQDENTSCMMARTPTVRFLGHAVNKVLKDIIVKSKTLSGYDAPTYQVGTVTAYH